jgi:hypothetical protein
MVLFRLGRARALCGSAMKLDNVVNVVDCNQFFVTLDNGAPKNPRFSLPLAGIEFSYDHERNQLKLVTED